MLTSRGQWRTQAAEEVVKVVSHAETDYFEYEAVEDVSQSLDELHELTDAAVLDLRLSAAFVCADERTARKYCEARAEFRARSALLDVHVEVRMMRCSCCCCSCCCSC